MGQPLRLSPSGPPFEGSSTARFLEWNNTTKEWDIVTLAELLGGLNALLYADIPDTSCAVPALAAAGDSDVVSLAVAGMVPGDFALVTLSAPGATGVVINGTAGCLAPGVAIFIVTATKAYAGGNLDFAGLHLKRPA